MIKKIKKYEPVVNDSWGFCLQVAVTDGPPPDFSVSLCDNMPEEPQKHRWPHTAVKRTCVCVCVFLRYGTLCVSIAAQTIWQGHNQIPITHSGLFTSLFVFKTKPHSVCYLLNLTVFYSVLESNSNKNRGIRHCSTPRRYCSTPCPENARN